MQQNLTNPQILNRRNFNESVLEEIILNTCPSFEEDLSGGHYLYHLKIDLHCAKMWLAVEQNPLNVWVILRAEINEDKPDWFLG